MHVYTNCKCNANILMQFLACMIHTPKRIWPALSFPGTMTKVAIYSSQSDSISSSQVQLLSRTGESTAEATLSKCSSSWSGEITTPDVGNYTYQIKGQDTSNNPFVYFTRRKVSFQSGEKYFNFVSSEVDDVTAEIGDPVALSFTLTSNNPFGSTTFQFAVEDLHGFSCICHTSAGCHCIMERVLK